MLKLIFPPNKLWGIKISPRIPCWRDTGENKKTNKSTKSYRNRTSEEQKKTKLKKHHSKEQTRPRYKKTHRNRTSEKNLKEPSVRLPQEQKRFCLTESRKNNHTEHAPQNNPNLPCSKTILIPRSKTNLVPNKNPTTVWITTAGGGEPIPGKRPTWNLAWTRKED